MLTYLPKMEEPRDIFLDAVELEDITALFDEPPES
jgi:hypothetical protein